MCKSVITGFKSVASCGKMVRFAGNRLNMGIIATALSLFCILTLPQAASASTGVSPHEFRFSELTSKDGLSQNGVVTMAEDRNGNIWMGTNDGLNRYDGYDFSVYRYAPEDTGTIQSNIINKVYRDSEDRLWVCTANGLSLYDERLDRFTRIALDGLHSIEDIVETGDGKLLLTTRNASYIYDCGSGDFTEFRIDGKPFRFYASLKDGDDIILCSMARFVETLGVADGKIVRKRPPLALPDFGRAILPLGDGRYLIGSNGSGVLLADLRQGDVSKCFPEAGPFVNSLGKDSHRTVWVGSSTGLRAYENGKCVYNSSPAPAIERLVRSIYSDSKGGLWIGTSYVGVKYMSGRKERFSTLTFADAPEALDNDVVTGLVPDNNGNIWIGTRYGGLNCYAPSDGTRRHYDFNNVHCLHVSPDGLTVYAGSEMNGLGIIDVRSGQIQRLKRPSDVMALCEAGNGKLWLGTLVGLYLFSPDKLSMTRVELGSPGRITRILTLGKDREGNLWVGSKESLKVYRADADNRLTDITPEEFKNLIQVQCLSFCSGGSVMIGTADGLLHWAPQREKPDSGKLSRVQGLQFMSVRGIERDDESYLWISTDKYLCRYNPKNGECRFHPAGNGFACSQFTQYSNCRDSSGRLYFGGIRGLSSFRPEELGTDTTTVAPVLSGLMLNNKEVRPADGTGILPCNIASAGKIVLKHYQNSITLRFSCPDFSSWHGSSFRYRLDGIDREWVTARSREATYSNLDKGKYVFRVMAANSDGVWAPEEAKLEIRVLPIWYRSIPARIFFALAALALISFGAYKLIRGINRRNERRMAEMASRYENRIRRARLDRFIDPAYQLRVQDEAFLTKVIESIDSHCSDPEFSVERLASDACMSRGNLHLKLKSITGRTPIELIRAIRMEKACDLLKEGRLSVAEIAEQTGFQTSSYFITAFRKTFGMTPGKYASMMK